jgi:polysaccharide pyruvyl transferase WcaK-like protein
MKMTDHQKRLWQSMIDIIQDFVDRKNDDFCSLVGKLEGALDASDIKDDILINQWYDFWTPLEIRRSIEENNIDKRKAIEELEKMKKFLLKNKEYEK